MISHRKARKGRKGCTVTATTQLQSTGNGLG